jgi:plastocyanin
MRSRLQYVCVVALAVLSACGGDGGSTSPPGGGTPGGGDPPTASNAIGVTNNVFTPAAVQVAPGTTVTWTWSSQASDHNVTFPDGVNSPTQGASSTFRRTFATAGTFNYQCTLHPGMTGRVVVQ